MIAQKIKFMNTKLWSLVLSLGVIPSFFACGNEENERKKEAYQADTLPKIEAVLPDSVPTTYTEPTNTSENPVKWKDTLNKSVSTQTQTSKPPKKNKVITNVPATPASPNHTSTGAYTPPAPGTNPPPRPKAPEPIKHETPSNQRNAAPSSKKPNLSHTIWNDLLKKHVSPSGKVDYAGIKKEKDKLYEYMEILEANPPQQSWDKNKQLAYWINVYNASSLKLIIENYPITSITKVAEKPWDKSVVKIGNNLYTLNQIENEIIRPMFNEPRIHFAVNCGAKSCPKLLNEAYTSEKLDAQLDKVTRAFLNDKGANAISEKNVELSKIFEWYKDDFSSGVIPFINKYSTTPIGDNAKVSYKEYDWNLNE